MKIDKVVVHGNSQFANNLVNTKDKSRAHKNTVQTGFKTFISYPTEDEHIAELIKSYLIANFPELDPFFISSSPASIPAGLDWQDRIKSALREIRVHFVLASEKSLSRRWINLEIGSSWSRGIPVVFLCYDDLTPETIPKPYDTRQALPLKKNETEQCLKDLTAHVKHALSIRHSERSDLTSYSEQLNQYL